MDTQAPPQQQVPPQQIPSLALQSQAAFLPHFNQLFTVRKVIELLNKIVHLSAENNRKRTSYLTHCDDTLQGHFQYDNNGTRKAIISSGEHIDLLHRYLWGNQAIRNQMVDDVLPVVTHQNPRRSLAHERQRPLTEAIVCEYISSEVNQLLRQKNDPDNNNNNLWYRLREYSLKSAVSNDGNNSLWVQQRLDYLIVHDKQYVAAIEAKSSLGQVSTNNIGASTQLLFQMLLMRARNIQNNIHDRPVIGILTDYERWQYFVLHNKYFVRFPQDTTYSVQETLDYFLNLALLPTTI